MLTNNPLAGGMATRGMSMSQIGKVQLILLKLFYLSIGAGCVFLATLDIFDSASTIGHLAGIGRSVILAIALLSLAGFFQPLKMLVLLLFSIAWKTIWLLVFVIPAYLGGGLDEFTNNILLPVAIGFIMTAAVIPWRYVASLYFSTTTQA